MKLEWHEHTTVMWSLYLMENSRRVKLLGTMARLPRAWKIIERTSKRTPDAYWLDGDLTLEEAQRAAKLFLMVGRQ